MAIYQNEVAEKVLRILQTANKLESTSLAEARAAANGRASDTLVSLIRKQAVDEELVHTVLSRAFAMRRAVIEPRQIDIRALPLIPVTFVDEHYAIPYEVEGRFLKVAIVDPTTAAQAGQLKTLSNFNIEFQLITLTNFEFLRGHERLKSVLDAAQKSRKHKQRHKPIKINVSDLLLMMRS